MKFSAPHHISAFSAASLPSSGAQAELSATRTGFQHILLQDKSCALTDKEPFVTATKLNKLSVFLVTQENLNHMHQNVPIAC